VSSHARSVTVPTSQLARESFSPWACCLATLAFCGPTPLQTLNLLMALRLGAAGLRGDYG